MSAVGVVGPGSREPVMPHARRLTVIAVWSLVAASAVGAEFINPKAGHPPRAKPHRRSGAEGLPPLPLPATPLRRTERKRPPAPPALVGMIHFPTDRFEIVGGQRRPVKAFPTTQIDIERLMKFANRQLGIRYRFVPTSLEKFSWDPSELPLLYITGWKEMPALSARLVGKLRRYLYDGGTLIVHAQCGRKEFNDSAIRQIARILPNRELALLDSDSELFNAYYKIDAMRIRRDDQPFISRPPLLQVVYLGCRAAIIFSPIDLNCGWDVVNNPIIGGTLFHQEDALKLGVNIITATLANMQYARAWGSEKVFHQQASKTRDQLVIAQVRHSGDWDPTPHALPNLMKYIQANTTLNVQFKRQTVDLATGGQFAHPVIYMTGLRDFKLSQKAVAGLRDYLKSGGVLIADAAAGRKAFDEAFRREMKRVLPGGQFELLAAGSPIYQTPYRIGNVRYTDLVKGQAGPAGTPALRGITIDGQLAVIYSSLSLANGWEQLTFAYNRGYRDADALRLGVNIFSYALTH